MTDICWDDTPSTRGDAPSTTIDLIRHQDRGNVECTTGVKSCQRIRMFDRARCRIRARARASTRRPCRSRISNLYPRKSPGSPSSQSSIFLFSPNRIYSAPSHSSLPVGSPVKSVTRELIYRVCLSRDRFLTQMQSRHSGLNEYSLFDRARSNIEMRRATSVILPILPECL